MGNMGIEVPKSRRRFGFPPRETNDPQLVGCHHFLPGQVQTAHSIPGRKTSLNIKCLRPWIGACVHIGQDLLNWWLQPAQSVQVTDGIPGSGPSPCQGCNNHCYWNFWGSSTASKSTGPAGREHQQPEGTYRHRHPGSPNSPLCLWLVSNNSRPSFLKN